MPDGVIRGSCLCGAIAFEIALPFRRFGYCYCSRCRKATGAGRSANAYALPAQLTWRAGEEHVSRWDLPGARSFATAVCSRCGCPVPHATRSGREVVVPAGSLDGPLPAGPDQEFELESRAGWERR